jgi:glyoxylase-like metal-dependent hydrolase (beta-lactamase superfamily II)
LKVETLVVGPLQTNAYIVLDEETGQAAVVDPGAAGLRISDALTAAGATLAYILTTHGHADHTGGAFDLHKKAGGEYVVGEADRGQIDEPSQSLAAMIPGFANPPSIDRPVEGGEILTLGKSRVIVIATPGHTPGSMCYIVGQALFTGDTLFENSIGRYDLPGGDGKQELESIRDNLLTLPDQMIVYPGHGPSSTIGKERANNPFLQEL